MIFSAIYSLRWLYNLGKMRRENKHLCAGRHEISERVRLKSWVLCSSGPGSRAINAKPSRPSLNSHSITATGSRAWWKCHVSEHLPGEMSRSHPDPNHLASVSEISSPPHKLTSGATGTGHRGQACPRLERKVLPHTFSELLSCCFIVERVKQLSEDNSSSS